MDQLTLIVGDLGRAGALRGLILLNKGVRRWEFGICQVIINGSKLLVSRPTLDDGLSFSELHVIVSSLLCQLLGKRMEALDFNSIEKGRVRTNAREERREGMIITPRSKP